MAEFQLPSDLSFNREQIHDPSASAKERGGASWWSLVGEVLRGEAGAGEQP